jgi:FixJ family two-component response regulator
VTNHAPFLAVVDDDNRVLESLGSLLESADYAVRLFASVAEFLEGDCLTRIDCLITDIDMPVIDGFELLRMAHAARPELPIILITGHPEMLSRLSVIGRYPMFKKPFNTEKLLVAVGDALRSTHPRTSPPK